MRLINLLVTFTYASLLRYITSHPVTLHYITLHYITLRYTAPHYIKSHGCLLLQPDKT